MAGDEEATQYTAVADLLIQVESVSGVDELVWLGARAALDMLEAASALVSRFDAEAGSVLLRDTCRGWGGVHRA